MTCWSFYEGIAERLSPGEPETTGQRVRDFIRRIERESGVPDLAQVLADCEPTDLQSLLMEVYGRMAKRRQPPALLSEHVSNRFTRPSGCDPARILEWDSIALSHLPKGFNAIELSPVSPLGTTSIVAPISQDWVISTIRNTEVVADPTNVLALECAVRRRELIRSQPTRATSVRLAASHRVVRAQRYDSPVAKHHFRLFSLCTAGRTTGGLDFESGALSEHIAFYLESLGTFLGPRVPLSVSIADLAGDTQHKVTLPVLIGGLQERFPGVGIGSDEGPKDGGDYYRGFRFHVSATSASGEELELVDGGDTDWTQKLLNNAKERLVISGIGTERVCENFAPVARGRVTGSGVRRSSRSRRSR
jgi:hypothetical protein